MPRIRQDNDARYALRASFVDENGDAITGDTITVISTPDLQTVTDVGATTTNAVSVGNLTSTGIDDNATSTAITIDSGQDIVATGNAEFQGGTLANAVGTDTSGTVAKLYLGTQIITTGFRGQFAFDRFTDVLTYSNGTNAADTRITVDGDGNVGIGGTPKEKLHVITASNSLGIVADASADELVLENTGDTGMTFLSPNTAAQTIAFGDTDNRKSGWIEYDHSTNAMAFGTVNASSERMRINSSGNVLVGTSSEADGYRLVVQGNDQEATGIADTGDHGASILLKATGDAVGSGGSVAFGTTFGNGKPFAAVTGYVRNGSDNTAGDLIFANRNTTTDTSLTERMRLRFDGNFGIGTNDPGRKVHFKSAQAIVGLVESTLANQPATLTFKDAGETIANGVRVGAFNDKCVLQTNGLTRLEASSTGVIRCPIVYSTVVTGRDVYVSSTGNLGYVSSTRESKDNIESIDDVSWLYGLNPVTFNYRCRDEVGDYTGELEEEREYGLIAEEAEQVNPDLCFYDIDEDGNEKLAGVSYRKLVPALLKAVQDQQGMIETLQAQVAELQGTP